MGLYHDDLRKVVSVFSCALLLAGCSALPVSGKRELTITSEPSGATVHASGVEIGTTPLTIRPDDAFPPRFVGFEYRAAGTLSLSKPGCRTDTRPVDDAVLSKDIHVRLDCDPKAAASSSGLRDAPAPAGEGFAERLQRLERLRERGLISPEEYGRIRARILSEL